MDRLDLDSVEFSCGDGVQETRDAAPGPRSRRPSCSWVETNLGATEEELVTATLRSFGFKAASSALKEVVKRRIASLVGDGGLFRSGDLIVASGATFDPAAVCMSAGARP